MKPKPLWLLCLVVLLGASRALADDAQDRAAQFRELSRLHLQLVDRSEKLSDAIQAFQNGVPPKEQFLKLAETLDAIPADIAKYRALQTSLGKPDDEQLAIEIADDIKKGEELKKHYLLEHPELGIPAGDPAVLASLPGPQFPDEIKSIHEALGKLISDGEKRFPILAQHSSTVRAGDPGGATTIKTGTGARMGAGVIACPGGFDGASCGNGGVLNPGTDKSKSLNGERAGDGKTSTAASRTRPSTVAGRSKDSTVGVSVAVKDPKSAGNGAVVTTNAGSTVSGANPLLDKQGVPGVNQPTGAANLGAAAQPSAKPARSADALNCERAVNGPMPSKPQHSTIAEMCENHSTVAPVLAGVLDAVEEQFGTVGGIIMNLVFLLLGLLMNVATGGLKLILSLIALVGASWGIYKLMSMLISAVSDLVSSEPGSYQRKMALRKLGQVGGSLIILVGMIIAGNAIGKTKPGAAAIGAIESKLGGALKGMGVATDALIAKLPGPVAGALENIFGKAKAADAPPEEVAGKPAETPLETGPKPGETPGPSAGVRGKLGKLVESIFGDGGKGRFARVAAKVENVKGKITEDLQKIVRDSLAGSNGKITPKQYNAMLEKVLAYADRNGVKINESGNKWVELAGGRTKGVYPKSPTEIDLVDFGKIPEGEAVPPSALHELFHIFHTVQMRVSLLKGGVKGAEASQFLKVLEDGGNYLSIEQMATRINAWTTDGYARTASGYTDLVTKNLDITSEAMGSGKVQVPFNLTIEEAYAWTVSRAPILLGQSLQGMAGRVLVANFAVAYATNEPISNIPGLSGIDRKALDKFGLPPGPVGLRDLVNKGLAIDHGEK